MGAVKCRIAVADQRKELCNILVVPYAPKKGLLVVELRLKFHCLPAFDNDIVHYYWVI